MNQNPSVRVRFAPSPTGFLHIGGARTALFNWLYARSQGGKFLLRIEDTDRERSETRFTEDILESLKWLGFDWDEPPVFQSARFERYTELATELLTSGLAYHCNCTQAQLDAVREQCQKEKRPFRYPGTCREKKDVASPYVTRVKVPRSGETAFTDLIRGPISFQNKDMDDWVILRTDGSPTYNFSVVVDDHDQGMTHILRGDDHINNTPKQILLYQTLKFPIPHFAHLPMILGPDRSKLSKRHGAASTLEYRKMGYLPETLINFLVRLGWSHGDQEVFKIDELQRVFSLEKIGKANAIFNPEKLNWMSGQIMKEQSPIRLREYLQKYFAQEMEFTQSAAPERLEKGISIIQGKVKTIPELIDQLHCLFGEDPEYNVSSLKPEDRPRYGDILAEVLPVVATSNFTHADLETKVKGHAEAKGLKLSPYAQALRFAVTGGKISPGLFEMLEVQGKATVERRIGLAMKALTPK
jgi:glutamyl-tRNA synthetase